MSQEEKELDATPTRIAKARREGNVPRSSEFVAAVAFGAAAAVTCAVAAPSATPAREMLADAARGIFFAREALEIFACALLPACAGAVAAIVAGMLQAGGLAVIGVAAKPERLHPMEGLRRILSRETLAHGLRGLLAFAVAVTAISPVVVHVAGLSAGSRNVDGSAQAAWWGARRVLFVACATGLLFASAEYVVTRSSWLRRLRMSFEDFKREIKEQEGDPHVRGRRRTLHRNLMRTSIERVAKAAFVVTNPEHIAIALEYRPPVVPVPVIVVRAAEAAALRVRERAMELQIPIVEEPALARALFSTAEAGAPIPIDHYVAVAEIVVTLIRSGVLER